MANFKSLDELFIDTINQKFPNRFTIDKNSITYDIDSTYSATLYSNIPLYHSSQPEKHGSATCMVYGNTIQITSGVLNDIIPLLNLIR